MGADDLEDECASHRHIPSPAGGGHIFPFAEIDDGAKNETVPACRACWAAWLERDGDLLNPGDSQICSDLIQGQDWIGGQHGW